MGLQRITSGASPAAWYSTGEAALSWRRRPVAQDGLYSDSEEEYDDGSSCVGEAEETRALVST